MKSDADLLQTFKIEKQPDGIIFIELFESESDEANNGRQAELIAEAITKVVNEHPGKPANYLVDLTLAGNVSYMSPHAREVYTNLPKVSNFNKAAIIGQSLFLEITVNLVMQATGRGHSFKWFNNRQEAREWLTTNI